MGLRRSTTDRKVDILALKPGLHLAETTLEFSDNRALFRLVVGKEDSVSTRCLGGIIYVHAVQSRGQDRILRHPCSHFPWRRHFAFYRNTEFAF
jgi:hypothetical protein